jgi:hypothetical protein
MLVMFLAAWVLPAQACVMGSDQAAAQTTCPDCSYPCGPDNPCAAPTACAAAMAPTVFASAPSLHKAVPAAMAIRLDPFQAPSAAPVLERPYQPPARPPSLSLNIRFCTFQN